MYRDVICFLLKHYPDRLTAYLIKEGIYKDSDYTHMGVRMFGEI